MFARSAKVDHAQRQSLSLEAHEGRSLTIEEKFRDKDKALSRVSEVDG